VDQSLTEFSQACVKYSRHRKKAQALGMIFGCCFQKARAKKEFAGAGLHGGTAQPGRPAERGRM